MLKHKLLVSCAIFLIGILVIDARSSEEDDYSDSKEDDYDEDDRRDFQLLLPPKYEATERELILKEPAAMFELKQKKRKLDLANKDLGEEAAARQIEQRLNNLKKMEEESKRLLADIDWMSLHSFIDITRKYEEENRRLQEEKVKTEQQISNHLKQKQIDKGFQNQLNLLAEKQNGLTLKLPKESYNLQKSQISDVTQMQLLTLSIAIIFAFLGCKQHKFLQLTFT